ncbi:MAG: hypothetical protein CMO34_04595 [Verrucomicrobia bacterium]|nr:hypothetical protein [Verrucomicrobiota bacterium]
MKNTFLFICLFFLSLLTWAGKVDFKAELSSSTVEVGQRFRITFSVNTNFSNLIEPDLSRFKLLSGPNQSSSTQIINGNVSQELSVSYILVATEEGTYSISPATVTVQGTDYKSNALQLEVVATSSNSANARRNQQQKRKSAGNQLKDQIFIRAFVDKTSAYVGERITATYKIYYKQDILDYDPTKNPDLSGFWTYDLDLSNQRGTVENYNGSRYNVSTLKKTVLFPQKSGELLVDPLEMHMVIRVRTNKRSIWGYVYDKKEITVASQPITIRVSPLPKKGRPDNFSGAVGNFNMSLVASKDSVLANDAIDVTLKINGEGNLPLISAPKLNFPSDFEVYDPETENNFSTNASGAKGSKTFKYLVIPRHSGNFRLEPYEFSFFDLASKSYKTLKSDALKFKVEKGDEDQNMVFSANRKEEVEILDTDIRYIHKNIQIEKDNSPFFGSLLYYTCLAFIALLASAIYVGSKVFKRRKQDHVGLKKSRAKKLAQRRLSKARSLLKSNEMDAYYEEISNALYGYFSDKFNIQQSELMLDKIIEKLEFSTKKPELISALKEVLEQAEMSRFAGGTTADAEQLYKNASELILKTESA